MYVSHYKSPLGDMTLAGDGEALTGLWFDGQRYFGATLGETSEECEERESPVLRETKRWLEIYFGGEIPDFTPKLSLRGTAFRLSVWRILLTIPSGRTMTYGEIADRISEERGLLRMSAQAVGGAVGHNPISVIIPCHRVLGSDGSLTGYAGGVERKLWLLRHEAS